MRGISSSIFMSSSAFFFVSIFFSTAQHKNEIVTTFSHSLCFVFQQDIKFNFVNQESFFILYILSFLQLYALVTFLSTKKVEESIINMRKKFEKKLKERKYLRTTGGSKLMRISFQCQNLLSRKFCKVSRVQVAYQLEDFSLNSCQEENVEGYDGVGVVKIKEMHFLQILVFAIVQL